MPVFAPKEALPIHQKLPDPNIGKPIVQGAYDSLRGLLKAKVNTPDLQASAITKAATEPIDWIEDAEKTELVNILNAEQKVGATVASEAIEHWEETENIGNRTEADAKTQGGIVIDAKGNRTGIFYWKDATSGKITGPVDIGPAYTDAIRGLRRLKADGEDKTGAYDDLRNGDAVRVVYTTKGGTQEARTLQKFDEMIETEAAKKWDDPTTGHKITFADLQKNHPNLAHAYARKVEDDIAQNAQYSFHHKETKPVASSNASVERRPEETDLPQREENALAVAAAIENAIITTGAGNRAAIRPDYSFGILAQYHQLLKVARSTPNQQQRDFLTAIVTSTTEACLEENPQLLAQNPNLRSRLDLNYNYYNQKDERTGKGRDPIQNLLKECLIQINPNLAIDTILENCHPQVITAIGVSLGKVAKDPEKLLLAINTLRDYGVLSGGETKALQTLTHAGAFSQFREILGRNLGMTPEQLQNPQDFASTHINEILSGAGLDPANAVNQEVVKELTNYTAALRGEIKRGKWDTILAFLGRHWQKGIVLGMLLQLLQGEADKQIQQEVAASERAPA